MPILTQRPSQMDKAQFVATYGDVFEHSPWVAERAFERGLNEQHDDPVRLAEHMGQVLSEASAQEQLEVIRAHPDLAGKAAAAGELTDDSSREQAGAGLDNAHRRSSRVSRTSTTATRHVSVFPSSWQSRAAIGTPSSPLSSSA